ncbi:MAG: TonB-dependent receptor [Saprospiraceae bacterium]|nr:MAG: TonB-dependent receptor [Saprospiraceae bacterium]
MSRLILLFALCALATNLSAQRPTNSGGGQGNFKQQGPSIVGKISGSLLDSVSQQPIEFATVVLVDTKTNKEVDGSITDDKGEFKLQNVKNGDYQLVFSFIGYNNKTLNEVSTTLEKPDLDLGPVFMLSEGINLQEVTVTGESAVIENKIDKIVYNAEKDVSATGGDAADVLRRVPLLAVDFEGNVSLRGSSNIQVLVNGKPSSIFATNLADALKSIPADQIKSVEVITTPTAKYDGEGSAGIINIITKKKSVEGFTGSVNTSIGTRQNNANLALNVASGRFGMNMSVGSWFSWPREAKTTLLRETSYDNEVMGLLERIGTSESNSYGPNGSIGIFYDFNAYNSISSSVSFRGFGNKNNDLTTLSEIDPIKNINRSYSQIGETSRFRGGLDWTNDYRRTFKKPEQELSFGYQLSVARSTQDGDILRTSNDPELVQDALTENDGLNLENTLQLDYVHPISSAVKLETGAKAVLRNIDSDYNYLDRPTNTFDPTQTDVFKYKQNVGAAYLSFNIKFGENYGLVAGARYEYTDISGTFDNQSGSNFDSPAYDNILPSIIISRKFKNFQTLKLSYTRRIQRPSLFYVNPYVDQNTPGSISFGNPSLNPELVDQVELGYNTFIKGIVLNGSIFYRQTSDLIERYTVIDEMTNVSVSTFQNAGKNNSIGFNFFGSATIAKIWIIRGGFNLFTYNGEGIIEGQKVTNTALLWNGNVSSSLDFGKGWKAEVFGFFRSPQQTLQGKRASFSMMNVGIQKEFSKKFSLGLRIVDPFNENKEFPNEVKGSNFVENSNFILPFRSFGVNLSYRFGKLDFKQKDRRSRMRNDDLKEGGGSDF